jgi:hypothetical protein
LRPEEHDIVKEYPSVGARKEERIAVEIGISGGPEWFVLPVPERHVLIRETLRIRGRPARDVLLNTFQEPLVQVSGSARAKYDVARSDTILVPVDSPDTAGLLWPDRLGIFLKGIRDLPIDQRVREIRDIIEHNYAYARTAPVRTLFQPHTRWIDDVLARRDGDCDVLNGLAVLLMRSVGIPAHLSVGQVGEHGRASPGLHAWVRYYDGGWRILDLTESVPVLVTDDDMITVLHDRADSVSERSLAEPDGASSRAMDGARGRLAGDILADEEGSKGPAGLAAAGIALALLLGLLLSALRRRLMREDVEPEYIRDMFVHHFREGGSEDLDLEFRPVFKLLDGRVISLAEIRRIASRHALYGAHPETELISLLEDDLPLLDRSARTVCLLEPFLPPVIWLDTLPLAEEPRQLCPELQRAERIIRGMDRDFRVHQIPASAMFQELNLRLCGPYTGARHVLIGEHSSLYAEIREADVAGQAVGTFRAVQLILERTTFYLEEGSAFLAKLAEQLGEKLCVGRHPAASRPVVLGGKDE